MILLLDNYDSFTYNVSHYLQELGADIEVLRNDAISAQEVLAKGYQAIIISPGPCTPNEAGITLELIKLAHQAMLGDKPQIIPIFGICLGHQAIGQYFGGQIIKTPPMHGKTSKIIHNSDNILFQGIPKEFIATRYHSLVIEPDSIEGGDLVVTAQTADGIIMAVEHRNLPIYGVQFHPESIASEYGHRILQNFLGKITKL